MIRQIARRAFLVATIGFLAWGQLYAGWIANWIVEITPLPLGAGALGLIVGFVLFSWRSILTEAIRLWSTRTDVGTKLLFAACAFGVTYFAIVLTTAGVTGSLPKPTEDLLIPVAVGGIIGSLGGVLLQIGLERSKPRPDRRH
jgi:hypothetical protein